MTKQELLNKLSIDEKINWTSGQNLWYCLGHEALGIDQLLLADGPHGVRVYLEDASSHHLNFDALKKSTLFPSATSLGATFNEELVYQAGETIAKECNMFNVDMLLGPGVNLKRSPLGGRNFEYYSEDPFLTGTMASAFINGVQSQKVGACIKHFALNEQETQRRFIDTIASKRVLHEFYLKPFKMAIDKAKPKAIMSSYNKINGDYASESNYLLKEVLRDKWQYEGVVISDWNAVQNKVKSIKNGMNLEMPGPSEFNNEVKEALANKRLTEKEIDESLIPLLNFYEATKKNDLKGTKVSLEDHHLIAREVANEAIVLLENDGILPLEKHKKVLVVGEFAEKPRINGGGSVTLKPFNTEIPLTYLSEVFDVVYAKGYEEENTSKELLEEIKTKAINCETIMFFTGTTSKLESEGRERPHMQIPSGHQTVYKTIESLHKNVITVLNNGSAINTTPLMSSNAIVESWFLGGANAQPLVDVLIGKINPSGRLSETFPLRLENTPHYGYFPSEQDAVNYASDLINNGYRYYDTHELPVRYPFGYGKSYTAFTYSDITTDKKTYTDSETVSVSMTLKNTGNYKGKEVVQLYVSDIDSYYPRPKKELKAFKKVELSPNEQTKLTFTLDKNNFAVYAEDFDDFRVESGEFKLLIGRNVRDIELEKTIMIQSDKKLRKNLTINHPIKNFKKYKPEKFAKVVKQYRKFPWHEEEEPTIRVLKRIKKEFNLDNQAFTKIIDELLE